MGLRKDFLVHQKKTVDSFRLVREDISGINSNIGDLKGALGSMGPRISALDNQASDLRMAIGRQHVINSGLQSKIEQIFNSVSGMASLINNFKNNINKLISNEHQIAKNTSGNSNSIKKLFSMSKAESLKNRQIALALKKSWQEIKKLKTFLDKKLKTADKRHSALEAKLESQYKAIAALKSGKRAAKPKKQPSKIKVKRKAAQNKTSAAAKTSRKSGS